MAKSRKLAAGLALLGVVTLPGIHRFYLGQSRWGLAYLLLAWKTPLSRIASAIEALWYLFLEEAEFNQLFNGSEDGLAVALNAGPPTQQQQAVGLDPALVEGLANAVRQLEGLRQAGLITETEFEQKRRKLLAQID